MNINLASQDMYVQMQFTTYLAAQQGDVLLLPQSEVYKLSAGGADNAFMDLTPYIENGTIDPDKYGVQPLMLKDSAGVEGVYAIPADTLYGLSEYSNDPAGSLLCLTAFGGNLDNAAEAMNVLIEQNHLQNLENYDRMRKEKQKQTTLF